VAPPGLRRTRIHGDYHLAQVLWHGGDFSIVDFEGDPDTSIAERRQKESPLQDVAGMLRAFTYAARLRLAAWHDREPETARRLEPWAEFWARSAARVFLDHYRATRRVLASEPQDPAGFDALLRALVIERDLQDLARELRDRPAMAAIPLAGLDAMLGGPWP
jgi:maltose alpha-D-glucosyltransferase/alpha-amylase